jgi:hypothetical protein
MTSPASVSGLTPEFDEFLFARINADTEETPLSMLSVLARLGLDPWEEAAKLAQLPRASAAQISLVDCCHTQCLPRCWNGFQSFDMPLAVSTRSKSPPPPEAWLQRPAKHKVGRWDRRTDLVSPIAIEVGR